MNLDEVVPLILTHNEGPNIARTLSSLEWAKRVVVVDSGSTDAIAQQLMNEATLQTAIMSAGRQYAFENLCWRSLVTGIRNLYGEVFFITVH